MAGESEADDELDDVNTMLVGRYGVIGDGD